MFGIIGESSDVFMFCLNHQPVDSVDCCSTWVRLWFSDDSWFKSLGWLLKLRSWSNTYLHFEILTFSWEKRSTLLHFCWLNAHFTKGGSLQNQAEEQITYQLCHMYSRADKSVGYATPAYMADHACHWDARVFFLCWSTFANTFAETKIWPIQIIQNATGFIESLVLHLSVQGCRYQRWSDYRKSSDPSA